MADEIDPVTMMIRLVLIAVAFSCLAAAVYGQGMTTSKVKIHHTAKDFPVSDLGHRAWKDGDELKIATYWNGAEAPSARRFEVRMLWSDTGLYVRFEAAQTEELVVSEKPQLGKKTMRLWDRDVCELFLAPDANEPRRYAEFEIAPTGEWLDLMVDWTKDEPRDWEYASGMESAARIEPGRVTMAMKIPWAAFAKKPKVGDVWLGNLFRAVGSGETRGYLAWSPTLTKEPQFHVPKKFGELLFKN
ncbi:MAG: carbohydrate-binding family 9-like protein [Acidobacteriota bacterium]